MALTEHSKSRTVTGISEMQKHQIMNFLQGAVYCWCKNRFKEPFAMKDLMGDKNKDWEGTPLIELYKKHINLGKSSDDAFCEAAKDSGWLLKTVIINDRRLFKLHRNYVLHYTWKNP